MSSPVVTLGLDYTGTAPDNLISAELHNVTSFKLIVPEFGSFFKEGLLITLASTSIPLNPSQYTVMELYQEMTLELGKDVYNCILITDPAVTGNVAVTYHALGGPYSRHSARLVAWLEERQVNPGSMDWDEIIDAPRKFNPAHHLHHVDHVYGAEYIVDQLTRLRDAIETGNSAVHHKVVRDLNTKKTTAKALATAAVNTAITTRYQNFITLANKDTIGLGLLSNMATLTAGGGLAAASVSFSAGNIVENKYVTTVSLDGFFDTFVNAMVSYEDTNLGINKGVEGLSTKGQLLVLKIGTVVWLPSKKAATTAEKEVDNTIYPPGASENDEFLLWKVNGNLTNYGGVFMSVNRATLETYVGTLVNDACSETIHWNKMLFSGEMAELEALIKAHAEDTKNPHGVDAKSIGLHKVENLPVITTDEIINKVSARKYLTTDTLMYYMKMFLTDAKPPPKPGETLDPNAKTMDDTQIIFTACKPATPTQEGYANKGELLKTFCDGPSRFARYADGAGGFHDELLEAVSSSCSGG